MRVVYMQVAWMIGSLFVLITLGPFSYELFFLLMVLGLVIVADLTAPSAVNPRWRSRFRWVVLAGVIGFVIVVTRRILQLRGLEVVLELPLP
jgi:choline-glycine betaine transporter